MNVKRHQARCTIINYQALKTRRESYNQREKTTCYVKENPQKAICRFLTRNFVGREWHNIFKVLGGKTTDKEHSAHQRIRY